MTAAQPTYTVILENGQDANRRIITGHEGETNLETAVRRAITFSMIQGCRVRVIRDRLGGDKARTVAIIDAHNALDPAMRLELDAGDGRT